MRRYAICGGPTYLCCRVRDGVVPSGLVCDFVCADQSSILGTYRAACFVMANREFQGACRRTVSTSVLLGGVARVDRLRGLQGNCSPLPATKRLLPEMADFIGLGCCGRHHNSSDPQRQDLRRRDNFDATNISLAFPPAC